MKNFFDVLANFDEKRVKMDTLFTRLEEASHAGDVNSLRELLKKDKLLLERVIASTSVRDNPLHVAAILGHAAFAHELIHCKPGLAKELNSQGLSPLHLAAAHDHVAVVNELLKSDFNLCLLREKYDGLLPVHIAVIKGRAAIVEVLVEACEEALHVHTNSGETILHLAVKYNTFDTVEFLIGRLHDLNTKDKKGNTILHLAMATKQLSVTKIMLSKPTIDVNAMNLKFSTPLDVLLESRQEHGDLVLGEMIRAAGGKTAAEVLSNSEPFLGGSSTSISSNLTVPPPRTSLQQYHCSGTTYDPEEATPELQKEEKKKNMQQPDILLLVATVVATATFQGALSPPGGVQPDDGQHNHIKGQAVLGDGLSTFLILDMFALFSSVSVILLFLCVVPRKRKLIIRFLSWVVWFAVFSMGMAFSVGLSRIYDSSKFNTSLKFILLGGWVALLGLGISGVLLRLLFFLLKKSGLWEPFFPTLAKLKIGLSSTGKRFKFNDRTKNNWFKKCCWFLKCVICILGIICVLAVIGLFWLFFFDLVTIMIHIKK